MYFLCEEERKLLTAKILPQIRHEEVHEELRGWRWQSPPLAPAYDLRLDVSEVTDQWCATGRDVYLRRVLGVKKMQSVAMWTGSFLQRHLADTLLRAKRVIYQEGRNCLPRLATLSEEENRIDICDAPDGLDGEELARQAAALRAFERLRIMGRVQDVLARQPSAGADSLAALAVPVTVEHCLDGSFVGLSSDLTVCALAAFTPMVFSLEVGEPRDYHRLATAAYALVLESLTEFPVDVGCTVYACIDGDKVQFERDLHLIDDELRQWLIDERDERMRCVSEEIDPGRPEDCGAADCPYRDCC